MENVFNSIAEAAKSNMTGGYMKDGLLYCEKCNTPLQTRITHPFTGKETVVGCVCKCKAAKIETEEQRRKQEERKARLERVRLGSFEDSDCASMRFSADDGKQPQLMRQLKRYADHFPTFKGKGQGLLLFGDVGTGKTFASACVANQLIEEGQSVLMVSFPRLIAKIQKDAYGKTDYISQIAKYDLLIVDDLGVERSTEYMQEQVWAIVDARYRAKKPMIVSTNLTAEQLKHPENVMAARIYGRILERCLPIRFEGQDRRKQNACYDEMRAILMGEG